MMDAIGAAVSAGSTVKARAADDPAKVKDAAKQFEALLIGQMMKSMHDADGGWLGTGDDQSSSSAMEYGQEIFAQSMAQNGGLGLADLVAKGLHKPSSS
jgi:Rod binding domain-containing protein